MNKTKIEWTDITLNPIKGYCPMNCSYCYAHDFYNRFKWDKTIRFVPEVLDEIKKLKEPTKIFLCSTIEMFHPNIPQTFRDEIYETIEKYPQHTFQILTKCSQNTIQIHQPKNVWLGFSSTGEGWETLNPKIFNIQDARIRFMSLEPFLNRFCYEDLIEIEWDDLDWVIIGGQTGKRKVIPTKVKIDDVIKRCRDYGVSVFIKDNCNYPEKIQEFPEAVKGLIQGKV